MARGLGFSGRIVGAALSSLLLSGVSSFALAQAVAQPAEPTAATTTTTTPATPLTADDHFRASLDAMKAGDAAAALTLMLRARELDPGNADILRAATNLANQARASDQAAALARLGLNKALADQDTASAAFYGAQMFQARNVFPEALRLKQDAAMAVQPKLQRVAGMWSKMAAKATALLQAGDFVKAQEMAAQAVATARDNFGGQHLVTVYSLRDLALIQQVAGQIEDADRGFDEAIRLATALLGNDHPETLNIAMMQGRLNELQLRFDRAVAVYGDAAASYAATLGADHVATLAARVALARAQQGGGAYDLAAASLAGACDALKAALAEHHPETLKCQTQNAELDKQQGRLDAAQAIYAAAIPAALVALGPADPTTLALQAGQGELHIKRARFADATKLLVGVLEQADGREPAIANIARRTLGQAYDELGDYAKAEPLLRVALDHQTRTLGTAHPGTLGTQSLLAGVYRKQGRLAEAERTFADAHTRYVKTLGDEHPATLVAANNLGEILEKEGLYDQAEPYLRLAADKARKLFGDTHTNTLAAINNLALLYESQGTFEKAEPLYVSVMALHEQSLGADHPNTIAFANNLAYLYMLQEKYAEAAPVLRHVIDSWTRILGERHQNTLKAINTLARVKQALGENAEAEALFRKAFDLRVAALGDRHIDTLRSLRDFGDYWRTRKDFQQAKVLLERALKLDEEVLGAKHPYTFEALASLAALAEDQNDLPNALKLRELLFERRSDFLNQMLWVTGENAREGYVRLHAPEMHAYLALLARQSPEIGGRKALEASMARKGLLLRVSSEVLQVARLARDPALTKVSEDLTKARKALAALILAGPTPETKDTHLQTIHATEERIALLEGQLGRASVKFRETVARATLDDVVKAMPPGAALVDFLAYKENGRDRLLAAVLINAPKKPQYALVKYDDPAAINIAVADYRKAIQDEEMDEKEMRAVGRKTFDLVMKPLAKALGKATNLFVVPDGILNILPFSALVNDKDHYLIEDVDLHVVSSVRDLIPSRIAPANGGYLINAGPDYDVRDGNLQELIENRKGTRSVEMEQGLRAFSSGMRGLKFSPLPGAEKEGRLIVDEAEQRNRPYRVYNKDGAQEKVLKGIEQPPEVLHVATHGFFLKPDDSLRKRLLKLQRGSDIQVPPPGDNPLLRAGLAFAGINSNAQFLGEIDTDNDGVLTALEVLGLNLAGTRLAVLSACETGLGEVHEGEGVYGLRRAFQEAGVRSVISSLWEVSDAGTQALMTSLHGKLLGGKPVHQALRESQLAMVKSSQWNHPYIWSAFMMVER